MITYIYNIQEWMIKMYVKWVLSVNNRINDVFDYWQIV